jgi:hypothetical protein
MSEPTPKVIAALVAASPDIRPECIRQAGEYIEYLTAMAKTWIINGDEVHGSMLQCLCLAFGFQQTEIERLHVQRANLLAGIRSLSGELDDEYSSFRTIEKTEVIRRLNALVGRLNG